MPDNEDDFQNMLPELERYAEESLLNPSLHREDATLRNTDFNKQYEFIEQIAQGGLKEIYHVRDCNSGRDVALAYLKKDCQSAAHREHFLRESRILASLEHTNIIPLYDLNYDNDNKLYFTTKLLSGETLYSILKKINDGDKAYSEKYGRSKLLNIFMDVCDAISYAHNEGIIHLDLKPENIQITEFNEVMILDWGFARYINSHHAGSNKTEHNEESKDQLQSLKQGGTPGYFSPEQAAGRDDEISETSDIFSLGAVLYSILYLKRPHFEFDQERIIEATINGESPSYKSSYAGQHVPEALIAVCKKAMSEKATGRYTSISELQNDIYRYQNDYHTIAEDINLLKFSKLFFKRHKKAICLISLLLAVIGSVLYNSYVFIEEERQIAHAQTLKINTTQDEIISGTLGKHKEFRSKYKYPDILKSYEKLNKVGIEHPGLWYDQLKFHAGNLNFKSAIEFTNKLQSSNSPIKHKEEFKRISGQLRSAIDIRKTRDLTLEETLRFANHMDNDTKVQILWNLNTEEETTLDEKLLRLRNIVLFFNDKIKAEKLNYKFSLSNNRLKVDLSNNPQMKRLMPLVGLPIDELILTNSGIRPYIGLKYFFSNQLKSLNVSGTGFRVSTSWLSFGSVEKVIAKNTIYLANRMNDITGIKHLDLEGSNISEFHPEGENKSVEYYDISFTKYRELSFLKNFLALKTLIIDDSMKIPQGTLNILKERGVEILINEGR